jgi:hypothetical protein
LSASSTHSRAGLHHRDLRQPAPADQFDFTGHIDHLANPRHVGRVVILPLQAGQKHTLLTFIL